ncbi:hypothetical protein L249_2671 [Ophiocordyceps polyrhachis-furcata BCC 54312]|uniref:Uncharacterized protein n=1 Tax=Ophiocordyceps polyrhachis-furcata BCC 54312 TaxID=1330021 RepID=A0A367LT75_9HYPO|nr:hypothetical protein L249_2671 [Ophiocordyceps polyrhachis-furcata BCC 54312]
MGYMLYNHSWYFSPSRPIPSSLCAEYAPDAAHLDESLNVGELCLHRLGLSLSRQPKTTSTDTRTTLADIVVIPRHGTAPPPHLLSPPPPPLTPSLTPPPTSSTQTLLTCAALYKLSLAKGQISTICMFKPYTMFLDDDNDDNDNDDVLHPPSTPFRLSVLSSSSFVRTASLCSLRKGSATASASSAPKPLDYLPIIITIVVVVVVVVVIINQSINQSPTSAFPALTRSNRLLPLLLLLFISQKKKKCEVRSALLLLLPAPPPGLVGISPLAHAPQSPPLHLHSHRLMSFPPPFSTRARSHAVDLRDLGPPSCVLLARPARIPETLVPISTGPRRRLRSRP